ncbi:MAG: type VI secretion system tube protein Hcp [Rhodobacteraceae bacterium]|nr:type VI secretion system tube protein Hcp [Paracoccaceae bacterium]
MAVDIHLKIDGIKGESLNDYHKDELDVLSWSWGITQSGTAQLGPGAGSGKVNVQDMHFSKYVDKSTPPIIKACCAGTHIATANLTVSKAGGDAPVEYLKIDFTEVLISSYQTGGSSDGLDRVVEQISFNFRKFVFTYTPQDAKGVGGGAVPAGWDIALGKAAT